MQEKLTDITADAIALQERDEFVTSGWVKAIAPAKVNLHLAVGAKREDGYHNVETVMHAVNVHDVVYIRHKLPSEADDALGSPYVRMVASGDVAVPEIPSDENLAARAIARLAETLDHPARDTELEVRIEKGIPAQAGLGGGSSDAAAAMLGAMRLWGCADDPDAQSACEEVARSLGADVAFFLHGGCAYFGGVGDVLVRELEPSKCPIVLVKPDGGVSTAEAYRLFDDQSKAGGETPPPSVQSARAAEDVALFNNLASASEQLLPELAEIRSWLCGQPQVGGALLCGSGGATFARCDSFSDACTVVAEARKRGWWARATSLGSARAMIVSDGGAL